MKGLWIKDYYILKKKSTTMLFLAVVYLGLGFLIEPMAMAGITITCAMLPMLTITSLHFDSISHWGKFSATLPVTAKQVVWSKYQLLFALAGVGLVIGSLAGVGFSLLGYWDGLATVLMLAVSVTACGILYILLLLPICLRLGIERARVVFMIGGAGVGMLVFYVMTAQNLGFSALPAFVVSLTLVVLAVVGTPISYLFSCKNYRYFADL